MRIVATYAAILALVFLVLSVRTLRLRRRLGIGVGDGGNETMLRAMRAHSNFAEYVPFTLLLLAFAAMAGASSTMLHTLGVSLLVGRISHAWGVSRTNETYLFRVVGMAGTFAALIGAVMYLLGTTFAAR
jgi:uncharacterized membrane protein YecN with MAPEG domain